MSEPLTIKVSAHGYLTALMLCSFGSGLLFYLSLDVVAVIIFAASWISIPFFAINDKISFDGKRLRRTGVIPTLWSRLNGSRRSLRLNSIEQVETQSIRTAKRGGNVFYRYRTIIRGKGLSIIIASGGEDHRKFLRAILPQLPDHLLDLDSQDLRDHLAEPKETLTRAEFARIPSADALRGFLRTERSKRPVESANRTPSGGDEQAADLRSLANELRVSGYLLQSIESFRRAVRLRPRDGGLLLEFARCVHSVAGVEKDPRLERKALAMLRLAERRSEGDNELLVRVGEAYFQLGDWRRALNLFRRVSDCVGQSFRAARGLAEIALTEGKIAHVIHHFSNAERSAQTPALRRWAKSEAEYFAKLQQDDDYLEVEIGRVNLLGRIETFRNGSLRLAFVTFPLIAVGIFFEDDLVAQAGWAVSGVGLLAWVGTSIAARTLGRRIPYHLVSPDE